MSDPTSAGTIAGGGFGMQLALAVAMAAAFWFAADAARKAISRLAEHRGLETSMARLFGQIAQDCAARRRRDHCARHVGDQSRRRWWPASV